MDESFKEAMLDWGLFVDDDSSAPENQRLPPLARDRYIAALRPELEEALSRVAEAINAAPNATAIAEREEDILAIFETMYGRALDVGLDMRLDAALAALPESERPKGEWACKYRKMTMIE
jgi:hypothetical protein